MNRLDYTRVSLESTFGKFHFLPIYTYIVEYHTIMSSPLHTALSIQSEGGEAGPSTPTSSPPPNNSRSRTKTQTKPKTKTKAKTTENKLKTTKARIKPIPRPIQAFIDPSVGEEETVHEIYESIAPHFALTRHKVSQE